MSAPVIDHETTPQPDDDPAHPIPSLAVLDVVTMLKGGGADLHIVIASPLQADQCSLTRLLNKIERYLGYIQSPEFLAQAGSPTPDNTRIRVHLHPDSAHEVFELLRRSSYWVQANQASLCIEGLDLAVH